MNIVMNRSEAVLVLLTCTLVACEGSEGLADGGASADTTVATLGARIGELEGPAEYLFGDITSVAADADGRIYVADRIDSSIHAYDAAGRHLAQIGREGEGPGEVQWPNDLAFDPSGRLHVRDAVRITTLARSSGSPVPDSVVRTLTLPGYANLDSRRARTDGVLYYYPAYLFRRSGTNLLFYLVFDSTGFTGDTIPVPPMPSLQSESSAFYRTGPSGGRMVDGLNRAPFEAGASWDITRDGHVISTTGAEYRIVETDSVGDTVRAFTGPGGRRPVPDAERADSAAALRERIDSLPVPLADVEGVSELIREGTLPDSIPATTTLHLSGDGKIWVGRWPPEGQGGHSVFDVVTREGRYERTVVVPAPLLTEPPPYLSDSLIVGVVEDPVTDVQSVLVFEAME